MSSTMNPISLANSAAIELISKLQDIFINIDSSGKEIALPQIVVVGAQSAGKSSLIERIVGQDFLPRGTGIVTRMPLILHLVKCSVNDDRRKTDNAPEEQDYAMFNDETTIYTDFKEVRAKIQLITDLKAGTNKGIMDTPIGLRIFSKNLIDLSLVDLPGLTNVAVGDQPEEIPEQIREMINRYIQNENSLILAVTPANVDIATSEPLKLAKTVDPEGNRTIAVITKLDLMDKGTDAMDVLTGATLPVKLGIIGVVNRGEAARDKKLQDVDSEEVEFFEKHYRKIASQNGCRYLASALSKILIEHVQKVLPSIVEHVHSKILDYENSLANLGKNYDDPNGAMIKIIGAFTQTYKSHTFSGQGIKVNKNDKMSSSAEMSIIFHEHYMKELDEIQPLKGYTHEDIEFILRNKMGLDPDIFPPSSVFSELIKQETKKFLAPSIKCAQRIQKKMLDVVEESDDKGIFARFPQIRNFIRFTTKTLLEEQCNFTCSLIENYIESQGSYMNTRSDTFQAKYEEVMKELNALSAERREKIAMAKNSLLKKDSGILSDGISGETEDGNSDVSDYFGYNEYDRATSRIASLVPMYFDLIRQNVSDTIIKSIVHNLIIHIHKNLQDVLLSKFIERSDKGSLFSETTGIKQIRANYEHKLKKYYEARDVLEEISIG